MHNQSFYISGITCANCVQAVTNALETIEGVLSLSIDQKSGKVTLRAKRSILSEELEKVLPKKYALVPQELQPVSKLKQLFPLLLIFGFMLLAVFCIHIQTRQTNAMMLDFMALFFLVFSFFKFLDVKGFQTVFKTYDPLAAVVPIYGWAYPFIELALGICYLMDYTPLFVLITTVIVLGITTIGVIRVLLQKRDIKCACLGSVLNLPMTEATLIENAVMLIMAGTLLV